MRLHNLIDDLNFFVRRGRLMNKPDHPEAPQRAESINGIENIAKTMEKGLILPQFDVGSVLSDMPEEEYFDLISYAYELLEYDLQLFPYPQFVVSYLWCGDHMLIAADINKSEIVITGFQKHKTLPLHPGIIASFFVKKDSDKSEAFAELHFAYDIYPAPNTKTEQFSHRKEATQCLSLLLAFGALLNAKDAKIETTPAPKALNKSRAKKGKAPIGQISEIRIVTGGTVRTASGHEATGSHASKRMHWRRGHVRRLASGVITNVRPTLVGSIHGASVKAPQYKIIKGAA